MLTAFNRLTTLYGWLLARNLVYILNNAHHAFFLFFFLLLFIFLIFFIIFYYYCSDGLIAVNMVITVSSIGDHWLDKVLATSASSKGRFTLALRAFK